LRNDDHSTTQSDDGDRRRRVARERNHPIDFSLNNRAADLQFSLRRSAEQQQELALARLERRVRRVVDQTYGQATRIPLLDGNSRRPALQQAGEVITSLTLVFPVIRTRSAPGRGPRRCRRCARCRRSVESSPRSRRLSAAPPATSGGVSWRPDGRQATSHRRC